MPTSTSIKIVPTCAAAVAAIVSLNIGLAHADPLGFSGPLNQRNSVYEQLSPNAANVEGSADATEVPAHLRRQVVAYSTREMPGTIVIDTPNTYLYFVLGDGRAIRYGIGIGREGFTWAGTQSVARKQEWPDWHPPAEMIERQPYLPRMMAGGPGNPLGARAMYLGNTVYRIHGTNAPDTIGKRVSSGCIRLTNDDVIDLYEHVTVGTRVIVLPMQPVAMSGWVERSRSIPNPARAALADGSSAHTLY
jgi:lipoprotein-anchoring transpeptidase ErfK/SrfK